MNNDSPDLYECLGTYPPYDARVVLQAFLDAGVRYSLDPGKNTEDLERAIAIRNRVLKIEV